MKFKISLLLFFGFVLFLMAQIPQIHSIFSDFTILKTNKIKTLTRSDLINLPILEIGDLVFRLGDEFDSILISQISEFKYSHIGIVADLEPLRVLHATTTGESDVENAVILSEFDEFLSHARNLGVARINFLNNMQKSQLIRNLKARLGEEFVLAKSSEPNLYCTTLIEREIRKILPEFAPKYMQINAPVFNGLYLLPKAFWEYSGIETIYELDKFEY